MHTHTHRVKCLAGCGRWLTAPASITRGYGRTCLARMRAAARTAALSDWTPRQVDQALELITDRGLVPIRANRVFRATSTDGSKAYLTSREVCSCDAGIRSRRCYHRAAVIILTMPRRAIALAA